MCQQCLRQQGSQNFNKQSKVPETGQVATAICKFSDAEFNIVV